MLVDDKSHSPTSIPVVEGPASELDGIETTVEPSLPTFDLDVDQDLFSTAVLEDSERHEGFSPKCLS